MKGLTVYVTIDQLDEDKKVALWVFGALQWLRDKGFLCAVGNGPLTPLGLSMWDQLDVQYKPSNDQILEFLTWLARTLDVERTWRFTMLKLVCKVRDDRQSLEDLVNNSQKGA